MRMHRVTPLRILSQVAVLCVFSLAAASALADRDAIASPLPRAGSPKMPFAFIENRGQANPRVRHVGTGPELNARFEDRGMTLQHGRTTVKIAFEQGGCPSRRVP